MITFNGTDIPGTHQSPVYSGPTLQAKRTGFSGVVGESEIRQGQKGRQLSVRILLHNQFTEFSQLEELRTQLDALVGTHGTIEFVNGPYGGLPRIFKHCTFEGFAQDPGDRSGPLPETTGSLDGTTPSWWVEGTLTWYQLQAIEDTRAT